MMNDKEFHIGTLFNKITTNENEQDMMREENKKQKTKLKQDS